MMFLGSCLEGFAQFLDLVIIANQFAEGAALMLDLVPLALGILVMLFALLECSLEALFDLFAINFRALFGSLLGIFFGVILLIC